MSTFILNPSDTVIIKDTIVMKLAKVTDSCLLIVKDTETNWLDVSKVFLICATCVIIAYFAIKAILGWQDNKITAAKEERKDKKTKEEVESDRKQRSDLLEKKFEILKGLSYKTEERILKKDNKVSNEYVKVLKDFDSPEVEKYIEALNNELRPQCDK